MCSSARYAEIVLSDACEEKKPDTISIECTREGADHARHKADVLLQECRTEEALEWLSQCITMVEREDLINASEELLSDLLADRAAAYAHVKRWSDAARDCVRALKLNKKNKRARYQRARVLCEVGRIDDAFQEVQKVLKPPCDVAQMALATSLKARINTARQEQTAKLNYARYFQLDPEKVTLAEVKVSCAGVLGWLKASIDQPLSRVLTLHARREDDTSVLVSCVSVAGNNVASISASLKQSLKQFRKELATKISDHEMNLQFALPDGTFLTKADDNKKVADLLTRGMSINADCGRET